MSTEEVVEGGTVTRLEKRHAAWPGCGQRTIPEVCMEVHEAVRGSSEGMRPEELQVRLNYLQMCLETWEPPECFWDRCLHTLIGATLLEAKSR